MLLLVVSEHAQLMCVNYIVWASSRRHRNANAKEKQPWATSPTSVNHNGEGGRKTDKTHF